MYAYVDMSETPQLGNAAVLHSARFPPPPKYHSNIASPFFNSCQVNNKDIFLYELWSSLLWENWLPYGFLGKMPNEEIIVGVLLYKAAV